MRNVLVYLILLSSSCQADVTVKRNKEVAIAYGQAAGIKPAVMIRWGMRESSFNHKAYNKKENAYGLFQIRCHMHRQTCNINTCGVLYNPHFNSKCALKILESCNRRFKNNLFHAFRCFNAGFTGAKEKNLSHEYARDVMYGK